jgi:hypothetical protein
MAATTIANFARSRSARTCVSAIKPLTFHPLASHLRKPVGALSAELQPDSNCDVTQHQTDHGID